MTDDEPPDDTARIRRQIVIGPEDGLGWVARLQGFDPSKCDVNSVVGSLPQVLDELVRMAGSLEEDKP